MEIELKYSISDDLTADKLWEDELLIAHEEPDSREKVAMKAAYFDTEDMVLSKNDIAFRIRMEGSRILATLKWGGKNEGALHQRQELNVPVDDEACFLMPSPDMFKESEIGMRIIELINGRKLHCIMEMNFLRRRFRIDVNDNIMEVSIDGGKIVTDNGERPISEIEIELFSGDQEKLVEIGNKLAEKYGLEEGVISKYARGLELMGYSRG